MNARTLFGLTLCMLAVPVAKLAVPPPPHSMLRADGPGTPPPLPPPPSGSMFLADGPGTPPPLPPPPSGSMFLADGPGTPPPLPPPHGGMFLADAAVS